MEGDDLHVPFAMNTFMERRRRRKSMSLRSATDLFSEWADVGRDEGMERGHSASVEVMLKELLEGWNRPFRAMDIGCGNGWVVRRLSAHALCSHASGVDGAPSMIAKARTIDPDGDYIEAMLPEWTPGAPYDLVHTMECLYYLEDPLGFLQTLHDEWMLPGGRLVIGVDHYTENPASHDWGPSLNVHMALLSMDDWTSGLKEAGFTDITAMQVGAKEDWAGTLVLTANRRDG
ncbi:MAG: nodulation protein S NodS [Euryarchaeota archaeon]|nr:nodulation protein S NodS [Euryarchaeota archaeon]